MKSLMYLRRKDEFPDHFERTGYIHPSGACSGPTIIFNTNCPMTMDNQIFENVWPPSLNSKNRLQNFQDMVESTIQRCFEITHFRRKIQQILEFQKVENQTVQLSSRISDVSKGHHNHPHTRHTSWSSSNEDPFLQPFSSCHFLWPRENDTGRMISIKYHPNDGYHDRCRFRM